MVHWCTFVDGSLENWWRSLCHLAYFNATFSNPCQCFGPHGGYAPLLKRHTNQRYLFQPRSISLALLSFYSQNHTISRDGMIYMKPIIVAQISHLDLDLDQNVTSLEFNSSPSEILFVLSVRRYHLAININSYAVRGKL